MQNPDAYLARILQESCKIDVEKTLKKKDQFYHAFLWVQSIEGSSWFITSS